MKLVRPCADDLVMATPRWIALSAFGALLTAVLTSGLLWHGRGQTADPAQSAKTSVAAAPGTLRCPHRIPRGGSYATAWDTTVFFVTDVLMRKNPVCGYDLSSRKLRGALTRAQWANEESSLKTFTTRYPAVSVRDASDDPKAPEAVYVLSRTVREVIVSDGQGRVIAPMKVGLFAPDAGMAAYDVELVLEDGHWRVDRAIAVDLKMSEEPYVAKTSSGSG